MTHTTDDLVAFGYAPGDYTSICLDCQLQIIGVDKRCRVCRTCAEKRREWAKASPQLSRWLVVGSMTHTTAELIKTQEALLTSEAIRPFLTSDGISRISSTIAALRRLEEYDRLNPAWSKKLGEISDHIIQMTKRLEAAEKNAARLQRELDTALLGLAAIRERERAAGAPHTTEMSTVPHFNEELIRK